MRDRSLDYKYYSVGDLMAAGFFEYLVQGGTDEKDMWALAKKDLDYIHSRKDCSDFRVAYFLRTLFQFEDKMPKKLYDTITEELLSFPYEDIGGHGMCTWTENHRLYAGGTEYLLAMKFPNGAFGDGRDAAYHMSHARDFLNIWIKNTQKYGLCEWGSNNYYSETMAGLSNIIQFIDDKSIAEGAKKIFLMMVFDMFAQTAYNKGYMYNPACARAYVDNKITSKYGNYVEYNIRDFVGEDIKQFKDKEGCVFQLMKARDSEGRPLVTIPDKFFELLNKEEKEIAMEQGVDIAEYPGEGLAKYSPEAVRYAFEAGAFSDYRVISNTVRYMCESGLITNDMLVRLMPLKSPILYKTGLLKLIKRFIPSFFDGAAMEKGRVYTYVNRNYSISAAFDYRVGEPSYQQNSLALNLSYEISLFANSPFYESGKKGSPGYWIGSGITPRAVAHKNIAAEIFDVQHAKLGLKQTHLFFPTGLFDEVDLSRLDEGILMGNTSGVNVCVRTNPGVKFIPAEISLKEDIAMYQDEKILAGYYNKDYDLMNKAKGYHYYLFEVDNTMSFDDFRSTVLRKKFTFDAKEAKLEYNDSSFCVSYKGKFEADGKEFVPNFKRPSELMNEYLKA